MRRFSLGCLVFLIAAAAGARPVDVLSVGARGLELAVRADDLRVTNAGAFAALELPGAGWTADVGRPRLPVVRVIVEAPIGATVRVDANVLRARQIDLGARVVPAQEPVEKFPGAAALHPFRIDAAAYAGASWTPSARATVTELGELRGARLVLVEYFPVRYLPARGRIEVVGEAHLAVRFAGGDLSATRARAARYAEPGFDALLSRLAINRDVFASPKAPAAPAGFLVVVGEDFAASPDLAAFLDWKRRTGYEVTVWSTADTGREASAILPWIQGAFDAGDPPPAFLLLVGDTGDIGYFYGTGYEAPATDLYYSTLAGGDYLPDLWVGRLPVTSEAELAIAIGKILAFEQATWEGGDAWTQRATFIASDDHYYVTEATHDYAIGAFLAGAGYLTDKLYSHTYGATGSQIAQATEGGRSMVVYSGHGDVTFWVDPYFDIPAVQATAAPVPPFVQSYACLTGAYDAGLSYGESWVRAAGGASAFLGSSVNSYWDQDDTLERGLFQGMFGAGGEPLTWIGGMTGYAKSAVLATYGNSEDAHMYFEMYNVLGDPSQDIWTAPPIAIAATAEPSVLGPGAASVTVTVPGVASARVGLAMGGATYGAGVTDASGVAVVPLVRPIETSGTMDVTVTGHNLRPFATTLDARLASYSVDDLYAEGGVGEVTVHWTVSAEQDVSAYTVVRGSAADGPFDATVGDAAPGAGSYALVDPGRKRSTTYWYRLDVADVHGGTESYGPVSATTSEDAPAEDEADTDTGCGC